MCRGEEFCDCSDTKSFCIMQELANNGGRAKEQHHMMKCTVTYETIYDDAIKLIRLSIPDGNVKDFAEMGAFVFVRVLENTFYDVPISVLYEETDTDSIELMIQLQGVKTKCFKDLKKGDTVFLRGPYLNGIQGLKELSALRDDKALVVCRGIGLFPSLHVISQLLRNNNELSIFVDRGTFNKTLLRAAKDLYELQVNEISIVEANGDISPALKNVLDGAIDQKVGLIHFGVSDYLMKKMIAYVENRGGRQIPLSGINNSHMCCGEGICGACARNIDAGKIVHLCKEQMNVYEYGKILI
jgi:NAD(P)H-flavin reductase